MFLTELFEQQTTKHAAFCFGRMNPPTVGHGQLIDTVASASQGGDYFIFVSQTQDSKKNPLDYATKVKFVKALFPAHAGHVVYNPELKTIMQVANWLYSNGYRSVTFVAGSDRLASFKELLTKYNGQEDGYNFDSINFVSSGDRDPDADGIAGVSASSAREAAAAGNFEAFAQATGAGKLAEPLYNAVRKGMLLEGWKGALAGAALIGGIGASMVASNPITIGDVTYLSNWAGPDSPAEIESSQVITHNGKKYLVWKGQGSRLRNRAMFYKEIKPEQSAKPTNEEIDSGKIHNLLWSIRQYLGKAMPDVGIRPYEVGTRVWTRGDGTRHRDPARLQFNSVEERDQAFDHLSKALTGARVTQVSGEFGSDPHQEALVWKGKVIGKYGNNSISLGSASRVTNPNSVWREKPVVDEHIIKHGSGYRLVSKKTGKNLGDFPTKAAAKKHEREVQYFKHMNEAQQHTEVIKHRVGEWIVYLDNHSITRAMTRGIGPRMTSNLVTAVAMIPNLEDKVPVGGAFWIKDSKTNSSLYFKRLNVPSEPLAVRCETAVKDEPRAGSRTPVFTVNAYTGPERPEHQKFMAHLKHLSRFTGVNPLASKFSQNVQQGKMGDNPELIRNPETQDSHRYDRAFKQAGKMDKVEECASGYIPKNKKEAKDPRWSNALTVDVHPDTPNKNMKALGLI